MDMQSWQGLWEVVFYGASGLFYIVVTVVAVKGLGDLKEMLVKILSGKNE